MHRAPRVGVPGGILAAILLLLSACAELPMPVAEEQATAAAGYGRAFGRVEYLEEGKAATWTTWGGDALTVFVRNAGSGEMHYKSLVSDGVFYWPLVAGDYELLGYQVLRRSVRRTELTGRLMATFTVPKFGQAVYIGDLRIETRGNASRFRVEDRYDDARKRIESKPGNFDVLKGLMRLEGRTGSYRQVVQICDARWGVPCDKTYQGVVPTRPAGTAEGFPDADSLAPLLEWKPSSRPDVSYDVVVHESLTFKYAGIGNVRRMRGRVVAYGEALREPRFVPDVPLAPGKRYEWSVRVREGDTVSSWSATSYSYFAVVAAGSGSGQGFGFVTPGGR